MSNFEKAQERFYSLNVMRVFLLLGKITSVIILGFSFLVITSTFLSFLGLILGTCLFLTLSYWQQLYKEEGIELERKTENELRRKIKKLKENKRHLQKEDVS